MDSKHSAFTHRLRNGVAERAWAAGSAPVAGLRPKYIPNTPIGTRRLSRNFAATAFAALALLAEAGTSPSHAQGTSLGTAASFGVLAGSTVTNTGSSVINGNVGVWPGTAIVGFPPGFVTPPFTIHAGDAVALQAQIG